MSRSDRAVSETAGVASDEPNCALVGLPWIKPDHASIQLGALKSAVNDANPDYDVEATARHYYKDIVACLPGSVCQQIFNGTGAMIGEYYAASLLFPDKEDELLSVIDGDVGMEPDRFRSRIDAFLDDVAEDIVSDDFEVVGFSASLVQLMTSLVVARRVADRDPDVNIVFGGAVLNATLAEELMAEFPFVDVMCYGEGERVVGGVFDALLDADRERVSEVPNVTYRHEGIVYSTEEADAVDLEHLPTPDYDEYFDESLVSDLPMYPKVAVETSRGCFYGDCEYCNLNQQWGPDYRGKSGRSAYEEVRYLVDEYSTTRVLFVDTNITNRRDLLEKLAEDDIDYECWAEVSAHTNRNRDTLSLMADAGVRNIQIGIESFSQPLLDAFEKGVSVIRNVESLKLCAQFNISVFYNLMIGHPDETTADVQRTLDVIDYAQYYQPPNLAMFTLAIDSPMYEETDYREVEREYMGSPVADVFEDRRAEFIAPLLSTIVGYKPDDTAAIRERWQPVADRIEEWQESWESRDGEPGLTITDGSDFSVVTDKTGGTERQYTLEGTVRDVYWACMDEVTPIETVNRRVDSDPSEVAAAISHLEDKKLLFRDDDAVLALAIPKYDVV